MKLGLLIDNMSVTRWQAEALRRLGDGVEFQVYNCTNTPSPPRRLRYVPYYVLNLLSLRGRLTQQVAVTDIIGPAERTDFASKVLGAWQSLPTGVIDKVNAERPVALIKFGMGLLKVPEGLRAPILSYHHGDPRHFRGRPAGFYELLRGEPVLGQIVQILSNRLDAGKVVAFAETPIRQHSYRASMHAAYSASPLLLPKAIESIAKHASLDIVPGTAVYRLPEAWTVLRFAIQRLAAKARRFAYGAFIEKQWDVAEANLAFGNPPFLGDFPPASSWQVLKRKPGYRFLADPFPNPLDGGLLVEGLCSATGLGEILAINGERSRTILRGNGHHSYPATFGTSQDMMLLPEVCEWSVPRLYRLGANEAEPVGMLKMDRPRRLVDPTLFARDGTVFLFANDYSEGDFILRLWTSESVAGRFREHPQSPVKISPRGSRMGGLLIDQGGLYRVGQNGTGDYGNGVCLFRIDQLDEDAYRETLVDGLRFGEFRGPHTLNFAGNRVVFDFYTNVFAPLAGWRRLRSRIISRRAAQVPSSE